MRRFLALAAAAISAVTPGSAQAEDGKLDISLEARARFEAIGGQFRPAPRPDDDQILLLRLALAAEYDAGPFRAGGEIVDARGYFEKRRSSAGTTEINALEPLQAYLATDISDVAMAKAGRFVLNLGSRRLVARNNFRNTINGFTGVQGVFGDKKLGVTAFWTVAQTRLPGDIGGLRHNKVELDRERGSPHFYGAFVHGATALGAIEGYAYRLAENDSRDILTRNRHLVTVGGRIFRAPKANRWDYEVEFAGQGGHARASTRVTDTIDRPVHAGFVHATIGRTLPGAWTPRVAALGGITRPASGRVAASRGSTRCSARAVFEFGPTSLFGAVQRANLVTVELLGEVKPDDKTDALLAVRPLFLASATDGFATTNVVDPTGARGPSRGHTDRGAGPPLPDPRTRCAQASAALISPRVGSCATRRMRRTPATRPTASWNSP